MSNPFLGLIACDQAGGFGYQNRLPWHLPEELAFFKEMTWGHVMIMGHTTYDSLPKRAFEGREAIVFSKKKRAPSPGIHYAEYLDQCLELAESFNDRKLWVIGGIQILQLFFRHGLMKKLFLSEIEGVYPSDLKFDFRWLEGAKEKERVREGKGFKVFSYSF